MEDMEEIEKMFSAMGLETPKQRERYNEELSIKIDDSRSVGIEIIVSNNTVKNKDICQTGMTY